MMQRRTPIAVLAILALGFTAKANAAPVLVFAQPSPTTDFQLASDNLDASGTVSVITIAGGAPATPFDATFSLSGAGTGPATDTGGTVSEPFSGTFSVDSGGCGGTGVCLTGTFAGSLSGASGGSLLTLTASTPPAGNLTMDSDIIPPSDLGPELDMVLTFADLTAPVAIAGTTIDDNTGSLAGDFSAGLGAAVPEPTSLALVGVALLGVFGLARRRKRPNHQDF